MGIGFTSSDDELPDLDAILRELSPHDNQSAGLGTRNKGTGRHAKGSRVGPLPSTEMLVKGGRRQAEVGTGPSQNGSSAAAPLIRRRKLARSENVENMLLQPFRQENTRKNTPSPKLLSDSTMDNRDHLRARRPDTNTQEAAKLTDAKDNIAKNEVANEAIARSTGRRVRGRGSKTNTPEVLDYGYDASGGALHRDIVPTPSSRKPVGRTQAQRANGCEQDILIRPSAGDAPPGSRGRKAPGIESTMRGSSKQQGRPNISTDKEVISTLPLMPTEEREGHSEQRHTESRVLPPSGPKTHPGPRPRTLVSPEKLPVPPKSPHRPSMDLFWDQEFVDEWNAEHSPRKPFLPAVPPSPSKSKGRRKETKELFEKRRQAVAKTFLAELDEAVTQGRLAELARSTGGVAIRWSNKLNTTAGRAHWKKETVRSTGSNGHEPATTIRHHASIELAEKVIDDEHRLLNVIAHEFCHLANFMVSGITTNPHGKEFKAWAAKVSRVFHDRGIEVTTKHSYDIDFKYIWECVDCGTEFKRHSKSIRPECQRCGACKGTLKQTKPVPRAVHGKKSGYQLFVQQQMAIVRKDNPHVAQKDLMRLVAQKWAQKVASASSNAASCEESGLVETVTKELHDLNI